MKAHEEPVASKSNMKKIAMTMASVHFRVIHLGRMRSMTERPSRLYVLYSTSPSASSISGTPWLLMQSEAPLQHTLLLTIASALIHAWSALLAWTEPKPRRVPFGQDLFPAHSRNVGTLQLLRYARRTAALHEVLGRFLNSDQENKKEGTLRDHKKRIYDLLDSFSTVFTNGTEPNTPAKGSTPQLQPHEPDHFRLVPSMSGSGTSEGSATAFSSRTSALMYGRTEHVGESHEDELRLAA